jgi:aspartate racemase
MPQVVPLGGEVDWPSDEGVLGVVGVAPWATLDFCRVLFQDVRAEKDWHYPRLLLDINPKIPSRGRYFDLGEPDPSPAIRASIEELHKEGATVAVVACNTAHILYDRWAPGAPIPVPNIVQETLRAAALKGSERVAALVSKSLSAFDLYGSGAEEHGLVNCALDGPSKEAVATIIQSVKVSGQLSGEAQSSLEVLFEAFGRAAVDTVLLGCTELSILGPLIEERGFAAVDSNQALARAALRLLNLPAARWQPMV